LQDNRPLERQHPGKDASKEEMAEWAEKARKRILRDINEKGKLKYKNKKLREQLRGRYIQVKKLQAQIKPPDSDRSTGIVKRLINYFSKRQGKA
jgi:hypothetical protein